MRKKCLYLIFICGAIGMLLIGCGNNAAVAPTTVPTATTAPIPTSGAAQVTADMRDITAQELLTEINLGWNLGNSLDSLDNGNYNRYSYEDAYHSNYKMICYYWGSTWANWNASDAVMFDNDGNITFTWDTSKILYDDTAGIEGFGLQIWNFNLPDTSVSFKIEVTEAYVTANDGTIYNVPGLVKKYNVTLKDGVYSIDQQKPSGATKTSQLKNGTFTVIAHITEYPEADTSKTEYYETLWGNPVTTKTTIDGVKAAGFDAVRILVTYFHFTDPDTYEIDSEWLDRIEEVVNYVLENDMYCIINLHHDTNDNWLAAKKDEQMNECFAAIWSQIAARFRDYDEHLIFEGFNEILDVDCHWSNPSKEALEVVNDLNQIFVDTVRATGGNNSIRCLCVNTYAASDALDVINAFILPVDTASNKLIVEIHDYFPTDFGWDQESVSWTVARDTFGTESDIKGIEDIFARLNTRFISQGIPVIVGEFGTMDKNNAAERAEHAKFYTQTAAKYGIPCFWWDTGANKLIDRETGNILQPVVIEGLLQGSAYLAETR